MKKMLFVFLCLFIGINTLLRSEELLLEAESFSNKGGWVLDQQFMDLMGSPYLLAHGLGIPVEDAYTELTFPKAGTYYVYVRTYNWTSPWAKGEGPGKFELIVNGKKLEHVLGNKGSSWEWQFAGSVPVKKNLRGKIRLRDLSGFDGRCDAIYFTTEKGKLPPSDVAELEFFRRKILGLSEKDVPVKKYDFVVAGAGVAGMSAAVAAARLGCKVALINDRPLIGGNNSSEVRVHLGGRIDMDPYKALGGLQKEFGPSRGGNAQPADYYEDQKKLNWMEKEENVSLFLNYRVIKVIKEGNKIRSLIARHTESGEEICFEAPLFSDCTGDGTVGYLAGAHYRMGRESRDEFGEQIAPKQADDMTMGASVQWYSVEKQKARPFPKFEYGIKFTETNCEKVIMGEWTWETGMNYDQIKDFERIRDYGMLVVYSNWSFLKNNLQNRGKYENRQLDWVAHIAGKRESRRLMGDYILKEDDIKKQVNHEDASFITTWTIDLHFPDPKNSKHFPDNEFKAVTNHIRIRPYAVPYRCLYSRNINNLFMAGRNISVTHVALGSVRVMRTTGMMGEVVGMAASLCKKHDSSPREIYYYHLDDLKELMKKGVGVKGLSNNQEYNEGDIIEE